MWDITYNHFLYDFAFITIWYFLRSSCLTTAEKESTAKERCLTLNLMPKTKTLLAYVYFLSLLLVSLMTFAQTYEGDRHPDTQARHGRGVANLPNGDKYEGQYVDGQRHGQVVPVFRFAFQP